MQCIHSGYGEYLTCVRHCFGHLGLLWWIHSCPQTPGRNRCKTDSNFKKKSSFDRHQKGNKQEAEMGDASSCLGDKEGLLEEISWRKWWEASFLEGREKCIPRWRYCICSITKVGKRAWLVSRTAKTLCDWITVGEEDEEQWTGSWATLMSLDFKCRDFYKAEWCHLI